MDCGNYILLILTLTHMHTSTRPYKLHPYSEDPLQSDY